MDRALLFLSRTMRGREPLLDDPISEASEALEYWSRRAEQLPWHRRAQRREARELAARWRVRLVRAHLQRVHLGKAEAVVAPLLYTRHRTSAGHFRWLAWRGMRRTALGRGILMVATTVTVAGVTCLALVGAVAAHAVGL
jgi:hypothetical protein